MEENGSREKGHRPAPTSPNKRNPQPMDPHSLSKAITGLVALVERLRSPQGCPWDAKQTDSTIRIYLLEEAYEVLDAIEKGSPSESARSSEISFSRSSSSRSWVRSGESSTSPKSSKGSPRR